MLACIAILEDALDLTDLSVAKRPGREARQSRLNYSSQLAHGIFYYLKLTF